MALHESTYGIPFLRLDYAAKGDRQQARECDSVTQARTMTDRNLEHHTHAERISPSRPSSLQSNSIFLLRSRHHENISITVR